LGTFRKSPKGAKKAGCAHPETLLAFGEVWNCPRGFPELQMRYSDKSSVGLFTGEMGS